MDNYPNLTRMGVLHPREVKTFMVNSLHNIDVLRIVYRRREGSLLPESRTYRFPRVQKQVVDENDPGKSQTFMETNPDLRSALEELRAIREAADTTQTVLEDILEQIELLEEDIALRASCIRELTKSL